MSQLHSELTSEVNVVLKQPRHEDELVGPGYRLYQKRRALHLTADQVAQYLHLPVQTIEAIEADHYELFSNHAFVRGYLRAYAKLLGLAPDELIQAFNQLDVKERNSDKPKLDFQKKTSHSKSVFLLASIWLLSIVAFAIGLWTYWPVQEEKAESVVEEARRSRGSISIPFSAIQPTVSTFEINKEHE